MTPRHRDAPSSVGSPLNSTPHARMPHLLPLSCLNSAPAPPFSGSLHLALCRLRLSLRVSRSLETLRTPSPKHLLKLEQEGLGKEPPPLAFDKLRVPESWAGERLMSLRSSAANSQEHPLCWDARLPGLRASLFVPHLGCGMREQGPPDFSQDRTRWERSQGRKDAGRTRSLSASPG